MNQESLKIAFGDCPRMDVSKCRIATSYEVVSLSDFYVFDEKNEEPVRILTDREDSQLIVKNEKEDLICVVKTDKCLFSDGHKKCDCILFNNHKIYLVEIKSSSSGTKSKKRQKAVVQLGDTIKLLKEKNMLLSEHETKAIICFKEGKTRPTQVSLNTQRAIFLQEHNISLEEGNLIVF